MKTLPIFACVIAILCSCADSSGWKSSKGIDVAIGLRQPTPIKLSDFGKTIKYIALETTDDCLVGDDPGITVLKDKIVIVTEKQCFLFDKETGRFIASVGHIGNDPEGYSATINWIDEDSGTMYFGRLPNQLMKYNMEGKYIGKIELGESGMPSSIAFSSDGIIGYYSDLFTPGGSKLNFFDNMGGFNGSIASPLPPLKETMADAKAISALKNTRLFGNWAQSGIIFVDYNNGNQFKTSPGAPVLWSNKGNIRFKESFADTVYTIREKALEPYFAFNTGEYYWPKDERTLTDNTNKRVIIPYVIESNKSIFFQCIVGLYGKNELYDGIYNKRKEQTKIFKAKEGIIDDVTFFLSFKPRGVATSGEYVGLIQAADALEWLEENPEASINKKLKFLKDITDDMNPIVMLVK